MKEFLITVFSVLIVSCIFNSIAMWMGIIPSYRPYPYPTGIAEVKTSTPAFGCKRDDFAYPEIHFTDGTRPTMFITDITDKGDRSNAEFPLGANN